MSNRDFLRSVFTADFSLIVEKSGAISWCNPAAADLLGDSDGTILWREIPAHAQVYFPDPSKPVRWQDFPVASIFAGESFANIEVHISAPRAATEEMWLRVTAEPVFSPDLHHIEAALVLGHRAPKRELRGVEEAYQSLSTLVNALPLPMLCMAPDDTITFWNPAARQVFGWTEAEVLGQPLPLVPLDELQAYREMRQDELRGEVVIHREVRRLRKDGSSLYFSLSNSPVRAADGRITGTVCVYIDITERRKSDERLWQTDKLESLAVLAGGVAHDFNNLLTGILGNVSIALEEATPDSNQAISLSNVMTTVDRAVELTNQMLAYSGRGSFRMQPLDLVSLIGNTLPLVKAILGSDVSFVTDLAPTLPEVVADYGQIRQVMVNLARNAREAVPEGGTVWLRTSVARLEEGEYADGIPGGALAKTGVYCCIELRDSGTGMDRTTQERMFDPFFSTKFTGRGLGLAAVLGIVRGHKGVIRVVSAPNEGSCFLVYLPARQ